MGGEHGQELAKIKPRPWYQTGTAVGMSSHQIRKFWKIWFVYIKVKFFIMRPMRKMDFLFVKRNNRNRMTTLLQHHSRFPTTPAKHITYSNCSVQGWDPDPSSWNRIRKIIKSATPQRRHNSRHLWHIVVYRIQAPSKGIRIHLFLPVKNGWGKTINSGGRLFLHSNDC